MDFEQLYTDLFPQLVQVASAWVSRQDAEDLVQDVLICLWERLDSLSFITNIYMYASAAVRNKCFDHLKHQTYVREHRHSVLANVRLACELENPYHYVVYRELYHKVEWAVNQLPNRSRMVFMLSRYEEKPNAEIAHELGISVNTVENHMTKALSRLHTYLEVS